MIHPCFKFCTHRPAEREEGVGDVGDVLLLREVVGLEELALLQPVLQEGLVEPENFYTMSILVKCHMSHYFSYWTIIPRGFVRIGDNHP